MMWCSFVSSTGSWPIDGHTAYTDCTAYLRLGCPSTVMMCALFCHMLNTILVMNIGHCGDCFRLCRLCFLFLFLLFRERGKKMMTMMMSDDRHYDVIDEGTNDLYHGLGTNDESMMMMTVRACCSSC
jgi:hypothetical protein